MEGGTYSLELRTSGLEELVVDLLGEEDVSAIAALDHLEELYGMEGGVGAYCHEEWPPWPCPSGRSRRWPW